MGGIAGSLRGTDRLQSDCRYLEETRLAVHAHALLIEHLARLSLPVDDGGGQQFSCWCCVRHGQLESPRHKTPESSLDGLRDPLVL
jgi:hypothetical protein